MTSVQKAKLLVEDGSPIDCWFNPSTLKLTRKATWEFPATINQAVPYASFQGGDREQLQLDLLLHAQFGQDGSDVRAGIGQLFALLDPTVTPKNCGSKRKRPPTVQFSWGRFVSFKAVCQQVDVNEELFDVDGSPLRASVSIQLAQAEPDPGQTTPPAQNPTTRAADANQLHTVRYGDSLASVAHRHLGDPTRWREVAEANAIDDPLKLRLGSILVVPVPTP